MVDTKTLAVVAQGDREIVITQVFDAPRRLVFDAHAKPELVKRWLLGPPGMSMPVCEIDLSVGGKYRYVWRRDSDGKEMTVGGIFREIVPPERIVRTEKFDPPWYGEALVTLLLAEQGGKTTLKQTILFDSQQNRDNVLKSGMETGLGMSYNRLQELLAESR
jgi:uncharacterized protein YndB with AHSA1/START domain